MSQYVQISVTVMSAAFVQSSWRQNSLGLLEPAVMLYVKRLKI